MSDEETDAFLAHYGVKGMRWGVRKGVVNARKARTSKENKERARRKDARSRRQTIKDKDLDSLVKRLEQERKLKSLLDEDLAPGRTATKKLVANVGTKLVATVATGVGVWAVKTALEGGFKKENLVNDVGEFSTKKAWELASGLASNIPKLKK